MAPFNMRCATCGEYIYKGKKFNARKEDVENEDYLGIRIYRFYIKCTRCLQEISFKTDPRTTDYEIEAGATRNFMALKLAMEQELREEQEAKEEEKNNPMKLLEARTEQSRNEIELLESLEELKYMNKRQEEVDFDSLLDQYKPNETAQQREERLQKQDDEYIKTIKFGHSSTSGGVKRVAEEEIIEITEKEETSDNKKLKSDIFGASSSSSSSSNSSSTNNSALKKPIVGVKKNVLQGLVKRKEVVPVKEKETPKEEEKEAKPSATPSGLSLLGAYSDSEESNNSDN